MGFLIDFVAKRLTLAELSPAAGTTQTVMLAFLHAAVASQQTRVTQHFIQARIEFAERAGEAHLASAGLAERSAAVAENLDIDHVPLVGEDQRLDGRIAFVFGRKVIVEFTSIDADLASAGGEADTGDGRFAATCSEVFYFGGHKILRVRVAEIVLLS